MTEPYNKVYRNQRFTIEISAMVPPDVDKKEFRANWLAIMREHFADTSTDSFTIRIKPRRSSKFEERAWFWGIVFLIAPFAFYYGSHHA
jgi:hypothetical protein